MPGPIDNQRQEDFCQHMVAGKSQVEAYRLAGYKPNDTSAARLFGNVRIKARIAELRQPILDKYAADNDRTIRELAILGYRRAKDYAKLFASGNLDDIDSDDSASISEVVAITDEDGTKVRVKFADKLGALNSLAKIQGLMKDGGSEPMVVNFTIHRTERSKGKKA